jgi:hypothetical protein
MSELLCFLADENCDFRCLSHSREALGKPIVQVVGEQGHRLRGAFMVVQPGVIRISQQPVESS